MMKYDDLYFAGRYNFFTDCVEWYFLPKTEIKVFLKKMDIRGFGWRPSICICVCMYMYVCVCMCMYIYTYTPTYISMHIWACVYAYIFCLLLYVCASL